MTDTRLGRSPRSEAELVRELDRRLKALERSQTARIGPWVLSAPDGRLLATRPGEAALEVGQAPTPEVVDLSARGSVVSDMNTADLANAVGMPDVDPDAPPTIDQIRQWMVTNLFGPVTPGRIQQLPWAHLGGGTAELLDDPGFDAAASFDSGDPNITRNAEFGRSKPGSAEIVANGAAHLVVSNLIAVEQGEKLPVGAWVFYEELVASAAPVRVSVRAYHRNADDSLTLLSTTQVAALTATSGESADHPDQDDDWVWLGGTYAVPGPVGGLTVTDVVLEAKVTEDATGGTINIDDATVTKTRDGLPQDWILNLVPDLTSMWNGVAGTVETIMTSLGLTPSGAFWDDLFDLSDEIAWIQDKANDAGADAAAALADLASKLGISDWDDWLSSTWNGFKTTLLTNPGSLLGTLGMDKILNLPTAFDDLGKIFDLDLSHIPALPFGDKVKALIDRYFGGGPKQVVTQQQVSEPSGVPPTDADNTIPWEYLPPELTPAAIGHPWVKLTKAAAQTINVNAITKLTAWSQAGGFPLTVSSDRFQVPFAGLFHIKAKAAWIASPDVRARLYLYVNNDIFVRDSEITDGMSNIYGNEIDEFVPLGTADFFDFRVEWSGSGSAKDISSNPIDTYARITYIGATHLTAIPIPTPSVTFDAKGTADNGSGDGGPWNHAFGPNSKTIVLPFSHEAPEMPTVTCGPYNVPVLSGPTYIGTYFGFNARYSLAAAILPDAVKGTTQPITVDFPSGNAAFSGNSLSFNDVAYLGAVRVSSGNGGAGDPARILVPSNAFSQVAGGFGGMDVNFSGFNRTQDNIWNFIAGNTWAHVMGHAQGGLEFMASGGKWAGKFIELHP